MPSATSGNAAAASQGLNRNNPAVRRIMQEVRELSTNPSQDIVAHPLQDNLFEWHFTIRGPSDSEFEGGLYHGRIILPSDYPFKPPDIIISTPNGRFEVGIKVCLSISGYHPEHWQPSWSLRTMLVAMRGFFPTPPEGAIGALDYPKRERRRLAACSIKWKCLACGLANDEILKPAAAQSSQDTDAETALNEPEASSNLPTSLDRSGDSLEVEPSSAASSLGSMSQSSNSQASESAVLSEAGAVPLSATSSIRRRRSSRPRADMHWRTVTVALVLAILTILIKKATLVVFT